VARLSEPNHDAGRIGGAHKEILEFASIEAITDEMRELIEQEWPELVHKLPPKRSPCA
jgi:hypothetical protein